MSDLGTIVIIMCSECVNTAVQKVCEHSLCYECDTKNCMNCGILQINPKDIEALKTYFINLLQEQSSCKGCKIEFNSSVVYRAMNCDEDRIDNIKLIPFREELKSLLEIYAIKIMLEDCINQRLEQLTLVEIEPERYDIIIRACPVYYSHRGDNCMGGTLCKCLKFTNTKTSREEYICPGFLERYDPDTFF